jgi:non-heme chloroperoxidase
LRCIVYDKRGCGRSDRPSFGYDFDTFADDLADLTVSISPELMQWGIELALQASPKATIEMVRAFYLTDFRSDMSAFTMPTLIIHGDRE